MVKDYYNQGFGILWLKPKSKAPVKSKWTSTGRDSLKELKSTYQKGYNIGLLLGKIFDDSGDHLIVIDCDVKSNDKKHINELNRKLKELNIPNNSPICLSGRSNGSMHIYVKSKKPVRPFRLTQSSEKVRVLMPSAKPSKHEQKVLSASELQKGVRLRAAWEISIMSQGQQVVLPPSIHPDTGKRYKWKHDRPLSKQWLSYMDFTHLEPERKTTTHTVDIKIKDLDFRPVKIESLGLDKEEIDLLKDGLGSSDRSAECLKLAIKMKRNGVSDNDVLTVFTDRDLFLSNVGFDHAKTDNRNIAANWVKKYVLEKAKAAALEVVGLFKNDIKENPRLKSVEEIEKQERLIVDDDDWTNDLSKTKDGYIRPTMLNIIKILSHHAEGVDYICRNEFTHEDTWLLNLPWGSQRGKLVTDVDMLHIKKWLSEEYKLEPDVGKIEEAINVTASENRYHPVKAYLDGLSWDGVDRVDTWLKTYLNAEGDDEYLEAVGSKILLAMVKRIYQPGCKFDSVLILEGKQGIGKSTTARILASDKWFSDSDLNIGDKDSVINMQGVWVYEIGELSAMNRYDSNRLKEFISRSVDKIRPPYGRRLMTYPRQSIFIGTTNNDEYLKDKTGNRRYWPVKIGEVDMQALEDDRDQLLAEACERYLLGEPLFITDRRLIKKIEGEQLSRVFHDDLEDEIGEFLESKKDYVDGFNPNEFTLSELLTNAPCLLGTKNDRTNQMRIAQCLKGLGYESVRKRRGLQRYKVWTKIE